MTGLKVGLQLYSIRDDVAESMENALKKVKEIGYDYVEFAGYYGASAEEVRGLLDKYGLECVSVHQGYEVFLEDEKANIDYLRTIGAKYSAVPWMDKAKHKGGGVFDTTVADFKKVAAALKNAGITMLYHNHDFEFEKVEGKFLLDWLYESIPADLLATEIDTCWVKYAGYDPCGYIKKYAGRAPVVHLKDFVSSKTAGGPVYALIDNSGKENESGKKEDDFNFKPLGKGVQNIPDILEASAAAGAEYVIVEQDRSTDILPMEAVTISRDYLKSLGL